ncbi:hypothetical protein H310_05549 [Aphanomyces invadans]|uniref:Uncharacterized protein n=1 Tax=Aphanomyces invadans TaxID=157072 RepID=A0A024U9L8_9STRA|nr:hypothetical protein H310_05549 [Aphanomyces invadans]ETW03126.1 hypothetical protein H310_05549 [Aphanomyces invadans]|eukprot:XP_008868510.1 hypothetical protein H310_05549 [Aphanomyces invadans]
MYSGTLGRVNALEFRDRSPTKAQVTPTTSPLRSPTTSVAAPVAPASSDAIQNAFAKMKEVAQGSPACAGITEADLLACLNLASSPSKPSAKTTLALEPPLEPKVDDQTLLLNALLTSLAKLNIDNSRPSEGQEDGDDEQLSLPKRSPSRHALVTPPPSPVSAKPSPIKRSPSSLGRIQENVNEDIESPGSEEKDVTILPIHEVKRCLRGGSFASRIRVRRQPSLKELDAKRVNDVVEKLNRSSIGQLTTPRRLSVVDPKTRSLSRVSSLDELHPPHSPTSWTKKSTLVNPSSPRSLAARQSSSVCLAPNPVAAADPPHVAALRKKKKYQNQARMSTLASHIKKLLGRTDKAKRTKVQLDAATRVSNMRLGSSPKKCKVKHEELMTFMRPNCRPRRWVSKTGQPCTYLGRSLPPPSSPCAPVVANAVYGLVLERQQSYVSLDVMDNIGTRAACPVHLLSEKPNSDFSHVPAVVNSHNRRRRRRSSRRPKLMKRPSLWIVD